MTAAGRAGAVTVISLPDDAAAAPGSIVQVALSATPADGILGLDVRFEYDPDVLNATSVAKTPLSEPHTLNYNLVPAGRVIVSLFGSAPLSGSGPVVTITFQVVGALGAQTTLDITVASANEGSIATTIDDGLFRACDAASIPQEIGGLSVSGSAPTVVSWLLSTAPGVHDVVSGEIADLGGDGGATGALCLDNDRSGTSSTDPRPSPLPGEGAYYLVRVQNACGSGTYGNASSGAERLPSVGCP